MSNQPAEAPAAPPVPQPTKGGSYTLDPQTLELTRVEFTRTAADEANADAPPPAP